MTEKQKKIAKRVGQYTAYTIAAVVTGFGVVVGLPAAKGVLEVILRWMNNQTKEEKE